MTNEEKILAILEQMQGDISGLKDDVSGLKQGQAETNKRLNKLETKMDEGFKFLETCVNEAAKDTQLSIKLHERDFHQIA